MLFLQRKDQRGGICIFVKINFRSTRLIVINLMKISIHCTDVFVPLFFSPQYPHINVFHLECFSYIFTFLFAQECFPSFLRNTLIWVDSNIYLFFAGSDQVCAVYVIVRLTISMEIFDLVSIPVFLFRHIGSIKHPAILVASFCAISPKPQNHHLIFLCLDTKFHFLLNKFAFILQFTR